jgi:hypothetical protein
MIQNQNRQKLLIWFEIFKYWAEIPFSQYMFCVCIRGPRAFALELPQSKKRKIRDGIDFKISVFFFILLYIMSS